MHPSLFGENPVKSTTVWSCGGGTQSVAIAALLVQGRLPKPDHSVMVDVGYEKASTWRYANAVLIPELARVGITLEIISKADYANYDLWGGADGKTLLLPVFTNQSGKVGKLTNFCSGEWKKRTIERYLKRVHGRKAWVSWLGMSTDEMRRVRVKDEETGQRNEYPLVFGPVPMNRAECIRLVTQDMGWPEPPKSTCRHCPNQSDEQWRDMRDNDPDDFAAACLLDRVVRETDPNAFLHGSCIPLDEVDFDALCLARLTSGEPSQDKEGCDSGYCFV